ncbi:extracellular solute-binding protein [Paenibacillus sp. FSL R7-0048]|uniref:ABC transporter substrate-binding protein n=1 Tax=Paenibacillus TaxID=44249 RepID=UPI00096FF64A|nr:extracellular solute-binding protein [Paenibacillus odorifer]OMD72683.1 ABC transporter substrate-binding protein [Paenibacillus odorifer]
MRKYSSVLLSLLVAGSLLTACGGNNNNGNTTGNKEGEATTAPTNAATDNAGSATAAPTDDITQRKVTIKIHYPTPDLTEVRAQEDDKIKRFQEEYPNVEIVKDDWQYNVSEIGIKMAANEAPTFFNTYATEAKFLVEKGWVADITDLWNKYEFKDQINPVLQNQFIIDGKVFGVTQKGYVTTTMINKKMLDEKGVAVPSMDWTWDDMLNTAKGVADTKKGISGIAPMGKGNEAGWNWTNFLFEAGGEIQKIEGGKVVATFNSEAGIKALDFYKKLRWEANAIPQDWALGWGDAVGAFQQSRTAMVMAGSDGVIEQALNQGGLKPEDVLTYPMPAMEKGGKHTGVLGGDYLVINPNATPDEQEMAFRYITFDYFSDKGLEALDAVLQQRTTDGKYFIPPLLDYYSSDSDFGKKTKAVYDKYTNVYQYSPDILGLLDGKPEAQYNTQDYYATMSNVIQELFSKKGTDSKTQLEAAAKTVQEKFFDTIKVE